MSTIYNFRKISDLLACAGQLQEGQLAMIAEEGYKVVINLGLADGRYALKDEAASVEKLGMEYHHVPVIFDEPKMEELAAFIELMNKCAGEKTFVHCAANYRASVFTGVYLFASNQM
ncbi:MAG: protein tyrosine phosphatase family protein, partial [Bacteroidota bacterium]|nr:protein tyrosine phosphatase family protein [Bacteroidota bacterium]